MDHAVFAVDHRCTALQGVSVRITLCNFKDCVPATNVGPSKATFDDRRTVRFLHNSIIDGFLRSSTKRVRFKPKESKVLASGSNRGFGRVQHAGFVAPEFGE